MSSQTVGFVGLGIMGEPMAKNVLDAGYPVVAHNRSDGPVDRLADAGATPASSPAEVARESDVVITVLPDTPVVESVVLGEGEHDGADDPVVDGVDEGSTVVDMSTISPVATERIAEELEAAGADFLDAPISGGEEGAVEATLSIMVGGDESTFAAAEALFEVMGETVTHCGPTGAGQVTKAANQIIVGSTLQAVSEALLFAKRAGADLEAVLDAVSGGAAGCWALDARAPRVIEGNFDPGFFAAYQYKDLRIATRAGEEYGAPMPATSVVHEQYKAMETMGYGRDDHSAVIKVLEAMAGEEARVEE
ncbi:NAD(P)-dependent oxidoreductase [Halobium salinum]|uniref:NAD(P)-dependent oxidoreductase n=1 Tax=Halobium salinum TaxID=1364940 RepID=A0ABD5PHG1_9EURY|nr:NAD(P)-binding domain-containing protein [Halobium salinum]